MSTAAFALVDGLFFSPFVVPVAGCVMILGIVVAGIWSGVRTREMQSHERLAAIAKGLPMPPTSDELAMLHVKPTADLRRRHGNLRTAAIVLIGVGVGLVAFFIALTAVLQTRPVLCGAAVGLIPLGIGVALLFDARTRAREIEQTTPNA